MSRRLSIAAMASASPSVGPLFNWGIVVGPSAEASLSRALIKAFVSPSPRTSPTDGGRSEEHTSELQSLMRISYAVFCLKKQTTNHNYTIPIDNNTPN